MKTLTSRQIIKRNSSGSTSAEQFFFKFPNQQFQQVGLSWKFPLNKQIAYLRSWKNTK